MTTTEGRLLSPIPSPLERSSVRGYGVGGHRIYSELAFFSHQIVEAVYNLPLLLSA